MGFLSLKDESLNVPGNAGQKDQQMVLEFIRDNISNFGGDPGNVTLVGHSSGAASVGLHCLSEGSRGLFHRVIMLGAPPSISLAPQLDWAKRLAVKLGFDETKNDEAEILKFLETVEPIKLAEAGHSLVTPEESKKYGSFYPFCPVVEPYLNDSTFLPKPPLELFESAWGNEIDVMIGGGADEGLYFRHISNGKNQIENEIPFELREKLNPKEIDEIVEKVRKFYFKNPEKEEENWVKLLGDKFIWIGVCRFIKSRQGASGKTFMYKFAVDSPTQNHYRNRWLGAGSKGVLHADELSYIWKNGQGDVPSEDSMEFRAIRNYVSEQN